ncbi:MAG: peroxiredoxin [Verrucomicrobiaceae bacterium]|nr:MAG: peroxiredoxin [Verrucomicrobiaceae bacterium]
MKPATGDPAPDFDATVVDGTREDRVKLSDLRGEKVALVFYPKDSTPGCTIQACALRDGWEDIREKARIYGVSADGVKSHLNFIRKRELPYPLIADEDRRICEAYGVWVEKSFMGRKFMGIERTTFVIGGDGRISAILEKVSPPKHLALLKEALA